MKPLNNSQTRYLRGLAHPMKPVVMLGEKGLTDAVMAEVERGLHDHELIKVRLSGGDREQRGRDIDAIRAATRAALVQNIGKIAVFYRRHPDKPKLQLPR